MPPFSWLSAVPELGAAALTALAQTVDPNDIDGLLYPSLFPTRPVDSVKLQNIEGSVDFRPVADRREWNQRGREIPLKTPNLAAVEMSPIEAKFGIREREITELRARVLGNEALFQKIIGADVQSRIPKLAAANFRRIEVDAMNAWALGQIVVRDPQGGAPDETVALGFDTARYVTAPTAWNNGGVNAYDELLKEIENAIALCGSCAGVMIRLATLKEIQKDAPRPVNGANVQLTRTELRDRVEQDLGSAFQFFVRENGSDIFTDGGTATVRTKYWPAHKVAFMPDGFVMGYTALAPVARAWDLLAALPGGGLDVRGNTVYPEAENNGRGLTVECQINALTIPNEQVVYVVDAGV